MQRKVFDVLASVGGLLMVVVLVVAGGLLMRAIASPTLNVHNQLAEQQIVFPAAAAFAHPVAGSEITPSMVGTVSKYAGQPLVTGQQAQVTPTTSSPSTSARSVAARPTPSSVPQRWPCRRVLRPTRRPKPRCRRCFRAPPSWPAARGLRLWHHRHDRPGCSYQRLCAGCPDGAARRLRLLARTATDEATELAVHTSHVRGGAVATA